MENLLQQNSVLINKTLLNRHEECGVNGSFTLPDYCADIASVIVCTMTPHLQHRQWSSDRLLVDGMADVRVLYLDDERTRVHSAEFALPFSMEYKTTVSTDAAQVYVDLSTRYVNWRVVTPRCIEIRGAVNVAVSAVTSEEFAMFTSEYDGLETKTVTATVTAPVKVAEKIITVTEQLEFPQVNPPAAMLLGGNCSAEISDCRMLTGKAIVKGTVYVHQLYTDNIDKGTTACLDYAIPFSQILDVDDAVEGQLHSVKVSCLSDTERCLTGPDGENSVLDVTAKLLIQLCGWEEETATFMLDAYHTKFPVSLQCDEFEHNAYVGYRCDNTTLPIPVEFPSMEIAEVLDVCAVPVDYDVTVKGQLAVVTGKLNIIALLRDHDRHISCHHATEEFCLEMPVIGDVAKVKLLITDIRYRIDGVNLQLQVKLSSHINMYQSCNRRIVTGLHMSDEAYESCSANLLMYYAAAGESVWEIGRSCRAATKDICEENSLTEDVISHSQLLAIPLR